jgi:hypothetical protein
MKFGPITLLHKPVSDSELMERAAALLIAASDRTSSDAEHLRS